MQYDCISVFSLPFGILIGNHSRTFWMFSENQFVSVLSGVFQSKLGHSVTPHCNMGLPKMLPMCFFLPPGLALCLPKFRAYYHVFLGGHLDISITKQTSLIWSVYPMWLSNGECPCVLGNVFLSVKKKNSVTCVFMYFLYQKCIIYTHAPCVCMIL